MRVSLETSLVDSFTSQHLRLLHCLYQTKNQAIPCVDYIGGDQSQRTVSIGGDQSQRIVSIGGDQSQKIVSTARLVVTVVVWGELQYSTNWITFGGNCFFFSYYGLFSEYFQTKLLL